MKKNKLKSNLKFWIIIIICSLIFIIVIGCIINTNINKKEQVKKDALIITSTALRKYIENEEYKNKNNVAVAYKLNDFDYYEALNCPYNNKLYDKDSTILIHYEQYDHTLHYETVLECGKHRITYYCNATRNMRDNECELNIS